MAKCVPQTRNMGLLVILSLKEYSLIRWFTMFKHIVKIYCAMFTGGSYEGANEVIEAG